MYPSDDMHETEILKYFYPRDNLHKRVEISYPGDDMYKKGRYTTYLHISKGMMCTEGNIYMCIQADDMHKGVTA
jgi:hypothetical protein